jgi:nitrogen regulatory protein P-II 1
MKEIKAIAQPFFLLKVIAALKEAKGVLGMTVSEVQDFLGVPQQHSDQEVATEFVKKWKLEVIVPDSLAEQAVEIMREQARITNGNEEDIFVYRVEEISRIRWRNGN